MKTLLRHARRLAAPVLVGLPLLAGHALAADGASGERLLPAPRMSGGKPLLDALKERQSRREFRADPIADRQLSDLLWATFGMNRPEIDHRTAPSAMNTQDVDVYVAVAEGLFVYEAKPHRLRKVGDRDIRALTTGQEPLKAAAVQLVFVSDYARMPKVKPELRDSYAGVDTGCLVQNVYLFCASEGLATVVHEVDRVALGQAMNLRPDQHVVLAQAVGHPK